MAIAFDAVTNDVSTSNRSSASFSHTVTGANPGLLIAVALRNTTATVDTVSYAGVAATRVVTQRNSAVLAEIWKVPAPTTGANTVVVSTSATVPLAVSAISFTGTNQSSLTEASNSTTGNSTTPSVSVTTLTDNAWVVDTVGIDDLNVDDTPGAGQTERADVTSGNVTGAIIGLLVSHEGPTTPAGAVTMSWSQAATAVNWSAVAVAIQSSEAGSRVAAGSRTDASGRTDAGVRAAAGTRTAV